MPGPRTLWRSSSPPQSRRLLAARHPAQLKHRAQALGDDRNLRVVGLSIAAESNTNHTLGTRFGGRLTTEAEVIHFCVS